MRARLAHCWTPSREHSGMHIVGEPEKGLLWKSVNRGMPTSHQCSSVFLTAPATFTWLAYGSWCLTRDVFSVCFFPLFYSLITSFSKHALFTWTVPGAGLRDETIRIKGLGLAHRSVGSQMHEGFIPGVRCWMFGWHMGCVRTGEEMPATLCFPSSGTCEGSICTLPKTRSRKILFWLVEISTIPDFGFQGPIPLKYIFQLVVLYL